MQLSLKYKFAFLCNPKCASTAMTSVLRPYCETRIVGDPSLKHLNAKKFNRFIRPLLHRVDPDGKIETFCIIREPLERVESWYRYQSRKELMNPESKRHARYTGEISFEEFIKAYLSKNTPEFARIGTQSDFLTLPDQTVGVDRIFLLEDMSGVESYLESKIGKPIRVVSMNESPGTKRTSKGRWNPLGMFKPRKSPLSTGPGEKSDKPSLSSLLPDELLEKLHSRLSRDYEIYNGIKHGRTL